MRPSQTMHDIIESISLNDIPPCLEGDVILGGGVCGCLLAHELLVRSDRPVWIIEAGGRQDENSLDRLRPARWLHLLGSTDDDSHLTQPNESLAGRAITWPRGRGLGGSGRINAMIWVPPRAQDFQCLERAGLNLDAMHIAWQRANELFAVESPRYLSPSSQHLLATLQEHPELGEFAAYPRINRCGQRWTTEQLLLDVRERDPSIASRLGCVHAGVQRLNITRGSLNSLTLRNAHQEREIRLSSGTRVVCCMGALGTPGLLVRSGIGDPELISRVGLTPLVDLPAVGRNLHDHLIMPVVYERDLPAFLPGAPTDQDIEQWEQTGAGPLASNIAECGGFDLDATFQCHVTPTDYLRYPHHTAACATTLGVQLTRPQSRGWMEPIRHADHVQLHIHSQYMTEPADKAKLLDGVGWIRELADVLTQQGVLGTERVPGRRRSDDARLLAAIARYAQTLYHPGGTCQIGNDSEGAVTYPDFQLPGVAGLSIVDASLLPEPTTGNPTALLAMLACYAAERLSTSSIASRIRC